MSWRGRCAWLPDMRRSDTHIPLYRRSSRSFRCGRYRSGYLSRGTGLRSTRRRCGHPHLSRRIKLLPLRRRGTRRALMLRSDTEFPLRRRPTRLFAPCRGWTDLFSFRRSFSRISSLNLRFPWFWLLNWGARLWPFDSIHTHRRGPFPRLEYRNIFMNGNRSISNLLCPCYDLS